MKGLEIGDRVKVIPESDLRGVDGNKIVIGKTGTVKGFTRTRVGVEFDDNVNGHNGLWGGKDGYCWYIPYERLEKIEETEEETKEEVNKEAKAETMEQKILTVLREEIGVDIGEEFDVYENGEKQWTCKFEENGFYRIKDESSYESGIWKNIIGEFHKYEFKRKPFVPQNGEKYWHFGIMNSLNGNKYLDVLENVWDGILFDYGMLALGNVFRTKEEAIKSEDKLLEKLNELLEGE